MLLLQYDYYNNICVATILVITGILEFINNILLINEFYNRTIIVVTVLLQQVCCYKYYSSC